MPKKGKRGRPFFLPTDADRNTVTAMAAAGMRHEDIARCLGEHGIDLKTMYKYFRDDLDTAMLRANALIANQAFQAASRGEAWAVCFWLKCRARWKETQGYEITVPSTDESAESFLSRINALIVPGAPRDDHPADDAGGPETPAS